ncbi:MAG: hypothetical protein ACREBW_02985 [Candidatus Micrarchaeaceae archaeon]
MPILSACLLRFLNLDPTYPYSAHRVFADGAADLPKMFEARRLHALGGNDLPLNFHPAAIRAALQAQNIGCLRAILRKMQTSFIENLRSKGAHK